MRSLPQGTSNNLLGRTRPKNGAEGRVSEAVGAGEDGVSRKKL